MKKFNFKTLCQGAGIHKESGYSATEIITLFILIPIMVLKNVNQLFQTEFKKSTEMHKDTMYRLKNNENISWRRLLYGVSKKFKELTADSAADEKDKKKTTAFIIDDVTDVRTGYKMENITRVFDHTLKKTVYGFKTLVLTFFDGTTNIPLDFTTHKEKKLERKKAKEQHKKKVNPKSCGAKRRKEADTKKPVQAVAMLKRAVKNGFHADYVLCDSWFTSEALIKAVRSIAQGTMHLVAAVANDNRKYNCGDGLFNAKEIVSMLKKTSKEHRCRRWGSRYFEAIVSYKDAGTIKLFINRFPGQKEWRVFASTDTSLSYTQMI
jgi:hypothetical protein